VTWQLANAKVWDGSQWQPAVGGAKPWWETYGQVQRGLAIGTNVTAPLSTNTKGAWTEVVASTSGDADFMIIGANVASNTLNSAALFDLAFGASGSEVVKVENVAIGSWSNIAFALPFAVPSGTRIAIRIQSVQASKVIPFYVQVYDSGNYATAPTAVDVIGTSTVNSEGTSLSSTANAYAQVTASTANAYKAIVMVPSAADATLAGFNETYTFATGAAGAEVDKGSMTVSSTANELILPLGMPSYSLISGAVPAGTRLAVKGNQTITNMNFQVCLIGVR
jgi:hypothetical protein